MSPVLTREALEKALYNDELVLYYQPKVCLLRGEIIGAEALVRWSSTTRDVVAPNEFLPLATRSGLLHDITLKLLDQVVSASRALRQNTAIETKTQGNGLSLSINVAPNDLASRSISNRIGELLDAGTIASTDLQIEVTESEAMSSVDRVHEDLLRLKSMGIKLLMDDFGTGYSSIDRLSQLPFDALKLDKGVVKRMETSGQNLDVVRSAISMARELGMTSVAEGVESAPVYNFLIAHGCEEAQGYFIGKPMSLSDFQSFVAANHDLRGSQIGRVHQACLNLMRFRKILLDAAYCARTGNGMILEPVADWGFQAPVGESRLGLWYFGLGQALHEHPVFREIEQPLRDVHVSGNEFLQQLARGKPARQLDQSLLQIDQKVDNLIVLFHRLERDLLLSTQHVATSEC